LGFEVQIQGAGQSPNLGDHEHRFRQPGQVGGFEGLQLLLADAQPIGQLTGLQTPGLTGCPQPLTQINQLGRNRFAAR
jgi:hypothetical protein